MSGPNLAETKHSNKIFKIELYRKLSYKEHIEIFNKANEFFQKKGKRLNEKHQRLKKLVDRKGGIPSRKIMKFWEEIRQDWNNLYPDELYLSSRGPKKAYETIRRSLKN